MLCGSAIAPESIVKRELPHAIEGSKVYGKLQAFRSMDGGVAVQFQAILDDVTISDMLCADPKKEPIVGQRPGGSNCLWG